MIEVDQSIDADQALAVGMGANLYAGAAPASTNLETRAMIRKRIGPFFIVKRYGDQKPYDGIAVGALLHVVGITDPFQIELIPVIVACVA